MKGCDRAMVEEGGGRRHKERTERGWRERTKGGWRESTERGRREGEDGDRTVDGGRWRVPDDQIFVDIPHFYPPPCDNSHSDRNMHAELSTLFPSLSMN